MADNEIRVVISGVASDLRAALDDAKGDLDGLSTKIKEVPNKIKIDINADTVAAELRLKELTSMAKDVPTRINIEASADTGVAEAKLRLLKGAARDAETAIARAQLASLIPSGGLPGGGGGGGAGAAGIPAGILPGGAAGPGIGAGGIAAAAPLAVAGVGSLTAVAGSAGAAALGAGALGVGGIGILGAGLGPIIALAGGLRDAITLSGQLKTQQDALKTAQQLYGNVNTQLTTAQNNYNAAVKAFGPNSAGALAAHGQLLLAEQKTATVAPQVKSAQDALNQSMAGAAPGTLKLAESFVKLHDALNTAEQAVLPDIEKVITPFMNVFTSNILPTLSQMAKIDLSGIGRGIQPLLDMLKSSDVKNSLLDLSHAFAQLAPALIGAGVNLMIAFLHVAVAAAPFVVDIAQAFERWTQSFLQSLGPAGQLSNIVGGLVGQLKSWFDLASALGGLMVTIFSAGAGTGQGLVNTLTDIVNKWNDWLNTKDGQAAMKQFFSDSADLVKALFSALGPLVGAVGKLVIDLMPTFTTVIKALTPEMNLLAGVISAVASAINTKLVSTIITDWAKAVAFGLQAPVDVLKILINVVVNNLAPAWSSVWDEMKKIFDSVVVFILGGIAKVLGALSDLTAAAHIHVSILGVTFDNGMGVVSKALGSAQTAVKNLQSSFEPAANQASASAQQIWQGYQKMASNVGVSVSGTVSNTQQGLAKIGDAVNAMLKKFNEPKIDFTGVGASPGAGGASAKTLPQHAASGGWIGNPGAQGPDIVPALLGVGEAVLNHQQQGPVDFALQNTFGIGLGGLFGKYAQGGYVSPFPSGTPINWERLDMGQDMTVPPGTPVLAIGDGSIVDIHTFFQGQPIMQQSLTNGPDAGRYLYYSEGISPTVGKGARVTAGQVIAHTTSQPTGLEFGWGAGASGLTLSQAEGNPGDAAGPWSTSYATFLHGLIAGHSIAVAGGNFAGAAGLPGPTWQDIKMPKWTGPGGALGMIGAGALKAVTKAANTFGQGIGGASVAGGASASRGRVPGPVVTASQYTSPQTYPGFAELSHDYWDGTHADFSALGNLPRGAKIKIGYAGREITIPKIDVGAGGPGLGGHLRAIDLNQSAASALGFSGLHDVTWQRAARGGFMGGVQRFAGGGFARAAKYTPKPKTTPHHAATPHVHVPAALSDSLKRLLPGDVVGLDATAARYAARQVQLSDDDTQLTYKQGLPPYPAQPVVTLTDADAAALDPGDFAKLNKLQTLLVNTTDPTAAAGIQGQIDAITTSTALAAGDEIVNQAGMTVGRFFGPGGAIQGGAYVPGIQQRETQITAQLKNLHGQKAMIQGAGGFYGKAEKVSLKARKQRDERRKRIVAFLRVQVAKAQAIQAELKAITSGNLQANIKRALSKQAIAGRIKDLRSHKATVTHELEAERKSQAETTPLARDPTHTLALQGQLDQINQSISVESQLSSGDAASVAVRAAKSAALRNSLTNRLAAYAKVDVELGGSSYAVGTGGLIGKLLQQMDALDANRNTDISNKAQLASPMQTIVDAIAGYVLERKGFGGLSDVQSRGLIAPTAAPAPATTDATLLGLVNQQLQTVTANLATSQSQFGALQGFAPLVAGRLIGSFQSGISFVPQTGPAMVHKGEMILPDPGGPQGNRAAATVQTSQGPVNIELTFANNEPPLVKLVNAQMNQHALRIISDHSGQRARLMAGVTR